MKVRFEFDLDKTEDQIKYQRMKQSEATLIVLRGVYKKLVDEGISVDHITDEADRLLELYEVDLSLVETSQGKTTH